jgi:hypothetical protein
MKTTMDYFYLKLGRGNALAKESLVGCRKPSATIFFDDLTAADYASGKGGKEPREFVLRGQPGMWGQTLMVVIHDGEVWVLRPAGAVKFLSSQTDESGHQNTPKVMPVEIVAHRPCKDVPHVLAGIGSNQFYTRGTFRQMNDWGNYKAIDWVAGRVGQGEHWDLAKHGPDQLLECLSSTELETLVAKLFEAHGCFVPAYRGGMMKDIDLFAQNEGTQPIRVGPLTIRPRGSVSIQVKRWAEGMTCPDSADCLVGLGVTGPDTINAGQLLALVNEAAAVRAWLRRSLHWLPEEFLNCAKLEQVTQ